MVNGIPDLQLNKNTQCFPRYTYPQRQKDSLYRDQERLDNIPAATVQLFRDRYKDAAIDGDVLFDFVYGLLHSPAYREKYAANLAKEFPHIPYPKTARDFWEFHQAGKRLGEMHIHYEGVAPYPLDIQEELVGIREKDKDYYRVQKMRFGSKGGKDKSIIQYNGNITITGIPPEAHEYRINGRSPLEWIVECYQVKRDKKTQILNDPNEYADDPRYILKLIQSLTTLSLETTKIIKALPEI